MENKRLHFCGSNRYANPISMKKIIYFLYFLSSLLLYPCTVYNAFNTIYIYLWTSFIWHLNKFLLKIHSYNIFWTPFSHTLRKIQLNWWWTTFLLQIHSDSPWLTHAFVKQSLVSVNMDSGKLVSTNVRLTGPSFVQCPFPYSSTWL